MCASGGTLASPGGTGHCRFRPASFVVQVEAEPGGAARMSSKKREAFAKQFEAKVEETSALLEKLSDTDWKKTTAAEKWTVALTAHHIASSYESATHSIRTIAAGQAIPHFTREMLDEMNAQHAKEFAACTKAETIALHKKAAAAFRQHPEDDRRLSPPSA